MLLTLRYSECERTSRIWPASAKAPHCLEWLEFNGELSAMESFFLSFFSFCSQMTFHFRPLLFWDLSFYFWCFFFFFGAFFCENVTTKQKKIKNSASLSQVPTDSASTTLSVLCVCWVFATAAAMRSAVSTSAPCCALLLLVLVVVACHSAGSLLDDI